MFSTVIWHPSEIALSSPVVFVQYLAAMAVVRGVKTYARGYGTLPVRLKWPNDVYAEDPSSSDGPASTKPAYVKIGGILVNSTYSGSNYGLVVGVGVNVANAAPTTGLDTLARRAGLPAFEKEKLLARILTVFEALYSQFCSEGWGSQLENTYNEMWLHR
jgi:biotin--protein ligase